MNSAQVFFKRFKTLFEQGGWSQYGFSKKTGLSQSLIGRYLKSKNTPSLENLDRIASALGVASTYFIETEREQDRKWTAAEPTRRTSDNRASPARQRLIEIINHCDDKQVSVILQAFEILTEKTEGPPSKEL